MTPLRIQEVKEPGPKWDRLVESTVGGTYCHLAGWWIVMSQVLGHRCHYLEAWQRDGVGRGFEWGGRGNRRGGDEEGGEEGGGREGTLVGLLPLVSVRSRLFGKYLVSMPFLNYGGPLGGREARTLLAREALTRAKEMGVDLLELRDRSGEATGGGGEAKEAADVVGTQEASETDEAGATEESHPSLDGMDPELELTHRKVSVVLPLPDDPEVLWKDVLRSKVRSQVRRPMKEGLEARFGPDQVEAFYEVFSVHMRDLGTPVLSRELFEALPRVFGERVRFCVIYRDGAPVAAGCGFHCRGEFEITWASALRDHARVAPNMLLYWRMMEAAIEGGARAFNFGRCTPDTGSHRFKRQWGGEDLPLPWAAWSPRGELATPNPDQGKYQAAVALWQRLPVPLTRILGPPLARRIP